MPALPTILVADDVVENVRLLKNLLQDLGNVVFARDGAEALAQTQRHKPDIVLLDVAMPEIDGYEVCRRLKADPETQSIPVIFITAADAEHDEAKGLALGAIDYIAKPFAPAVVRARVQNQLALVKANAELRAANDALRKYKAAVDCSSAGIVITDREALVEYVNEAFTGMSGYPPGEVLGQTPALLKAFDPPGEAYEALVAAIQSGKHWRGELQTRRKDGSLSWEDIAVAPIADAAGNVTHFVAIKSDINRRKDMEEKLRELAVTDPLTGVANRRRFMELGEQEYHRVRRTREPLCLLMIDIDHFKRINDTRGHPAGDAVIRALAAIAKQTVRSIDTVARLGGEEFGVLLPLTDILGATELADRLREAVADTAVPWENDPIHFTASLGVAQVSPATRNFDALMADADAALYRAKHGGRNRVAVHEAPSFKDDPSAHKGATA
jgi:diguanylate cyclase (GGDEF)-like protein/PAS domain S-box-containing protein